MKGKEYSYKGHTWKSIYGNINTDRIYPRFKKGEQFRSEFYNVTRNIVSLSDYTLKNNEERINLSILDQGDYFEFKNAWQSTPLKSAFFETVFDEIVNQNIIENKYEKWRGLSFGYLLEIKERATDLKLTKSEDFKIEFSFKIHLKQLQKTFEPIEFLDPKFIIELANKSPQEVYNIGIAYLDIDNKKCIGILKTIVNEMPYVGLTIGVAYFYEGKSELSNNYITKALKEVEEIDLSDDFIGYITEIIATNEVNLGIANDSTIRLFFKVLDINQSASALVKLSYLILSRNIKHLKEFALENVAIAIEHNLKDENESTKISGFHIICSVLIWNDKFDEAEMYHSYFLKKNNSFLNEYESHVESYILLTLAKNNINFISNMVLDFPHLKTIFLGLFDAWDYKNSEQMEEHWSNLNIYNYNKINSARNQYCD